MILFLSILSLDRAFFGLFKVLIGATTGLALYILTAADGAIGGGRGAGDCFNFDSTSRFFLLIIGDLIVRIVDSVPAPPDDRIEVLCSDDGRRWVRLSVSLI